MVVENEPRPYDFWDEHTQRMLRYMPEEFVTMQVNIAKAAVKEYPAGEAQYKRWWLNHFVEPLILGLRITEDINKNK